MNDTQAPDLAVELRQDPAVMHLIRAAYSLLGDGIGGEWDGNPEYSRAIAELTRDVLGLDTDQPATLDLIRAAVEQ